MPVLSGAKLNATLRRTEIRMACQDTCRDGEDGIEGARGDGSCTGAGIMHRRSRAAQSSAEQRRAAQS